eukprot:gnl/MRDRNA2_/MRDRNA2_144218_c0_seq1.p1 gnl/MRDRNA2_/MRDRNA2_144218_c0~~gnl/MRDRNA2_/MRDRNA2_144218_c0_seq1.p1  ORF type:complete len:400 (+),score=84.84 gnl/MRDRNA2_/MRDRNA2_144218_c0_seq1:101-1300(+)
MMHRSVLHLRGDLKIFKTSRGPAVACRFHACLVDSRRTGLTLHVPSSQSSKMIPFQPSFVGSVRASTFGPSKFQEEARSAFDDMVDQIAKLPLTDELRQKLEHVEKDLSYGAPGLKKLSAGFSGVVSLAAQADSLLQSDLVVNESSVQDMQKSWCDETLRMQVGRLPLQREVQKQEVMLQSLTSSLNSLMKTMQDREASLEALERQVIDSRKNYDYVMSEVRELEIANQEKISLVASVSAGFLGARVGAVAGPVGAAAGAAMGAIVADNLAAVSYQDPKPLREQAGRLCGHIHELNVLISKFLEQLTEDTMKLSQQQESVFDKQYALAQSRATLQNFDKDFLERKAEHAAAVQLVEAKQLQIKEQMQLVHRIGIEAENRRALVEDRLNGTRGQSPQYFL